MNGKSLLPINNLQEKQSSECADIPVSSLALCSRNSIMFGKMLKELPNQILSFQKKVLPPHLVVVKIVHQMKKTRL